MSKDLPIILLRDLENLRAHCSTVYSLNFSEEHWELMKGYAQLLYTWSFKLNLVSPIERDILGSRHVWRALSMAPSICKIPHKNILDVGSGSGIPAIPLKICFPEADFYLVESRRKRTNFLKHVVRTLDLQKITVINARVEDWSDPLEVDLVTARSVANPLIIQKWVEGHVHKGSSLVCTLDRRGEILPAGSEERVIEWGKESMRLGIIPL